jgi:hypothetical protein
VPDHRPARRACPCCGYLTLDDPEPGTYDICEVCLWEDDPVQLRKPDYEGGANKCSLNQARVTFQLHGVSDLRVRELVRPPRPDEQPES